jgi:uncharacterized protein (TIGR03382 family)
MRNVIAVGIGVVVAVAVAAPPAQACSQLLPSFFDDLAPFENQHVPTNADLVVIGATFDVPAAGVLTGPDGVAAEVAWVVEEQLVRLDITDLLPGEYSLDFNGSGLRTVAFVVDDRLDTDAPAAPDLVDVVETPARQPGPLDWLFGVPDCGYSGGGSFVDITVAEAGDDVAYALVDGSPVAYADRIRVAGAGTVDVQLVDFAGNVSSAVSGSDDRGAGGCSSTSASSGLWALALLLLVRRRR